ncbi:unnamed protein product (macronuclear) [Paramecium tetraurelia]|uniref:SBF1/SBF2 domain-containing protein n=1 Tax=Paramecium tetraurelia TaxID=5888 RepID=A0CYQ2_PARTE|nr:uncharacterized protein GSPATT00011520001 [Paramecium tetraurelia]CAK75919.1 unnamed protein product [Paramecium tetraurelia]|eukprot:XP_001443316.1 hypothetical protein (macronuclear) [Paramecium tetraurelia strain d4-2]
MSLTLTLQKYIGGQELEYFENVVRESTKGRNDITKMIDSLQNRVNAEYEYSKNLEDGISELLVNRNSADSAVNLEKIIALYCNEIRQKIKESRAYAQFIKDYIINQLNLLVKDQNIKVRSLISDGRKLSAQLKQEKTDVEKLISQLNQKNNDYFQHQIQKFSQENLSQLQPQKKNENTLKSDKLFRNLKELREKLNSQQSSYEQFLQGYELRISKIIEEFQTQDEDRVNQLKTVTNLLFQNDRIFENLNQIQGEYSLYRFKEQYLKSLLIKFKEQKSFVQSSVLKIEDNWVDRITHFINTKCQNVQYNRQLITLNMDILKNDYEKINYLVQSQNQDLVTNISLCQERIHNQMQELWSSQQVNLKSLINLLSNNLIGRQIWVYEFQQFRLDKKFEICQISYQNIVDLLNQLLDLCMEELDAFTVRKLMLMTFTFYRIEKAEKIFLYDGIQHHSIFDKIDLWDAIFFESLHDEMKKQQDMRMNENINDSIEREKNTIFGFLGSLIENMLSFSPSKQNVRILTSKYCKLYMLNDVQIKQLLNIIDNSKQQQN